MVPFWGPLNTMPYYPRTQKGTIILTTTPCTKEQSAQRPGQTVVRIERRGIGKHHYSIQSNSAKSLAGVHCIWEPALYLQRVTIPSCSPSQSLKKQPNNLFFPDPCPRARVRISSLSLGPNTSKCESLEPWVSTNYSVARSPAAAQGVHEASNGRTAAPAKISS